MFINQHYLSPATVVASPNFDDRPDPADISLLVIHCISLPPGQFGGNAVEQLFCNRLKPGQHPYFEEIYNLKVSAHCLIRRDGEIIQFVAFDKRAWHAGVSYYQGRERCNDFSIGIELEGDEITPYEDIQYQKLAQLSTVLLAEYPELQRQHIVGHNDIAPGRKTDPGDSFDWTRFNGCLDQQLYRHSIKSTP